jgi:hypothetical protein
MNPKIPLLQDRRGPFLTRLQNKGSSADFGEVFWNLKGLWNQEIEVRKRRKRPPKKGEIATEYPPPPISRSCAQRATAVLRAMDFWKCTPHPPKGIGEVAIPLNAPGCGLHQECKRIEDGAFERSPGRPATRAERRKPNGRACHHTRPE